MVQVGANGYLYKIIIAYQRFLLVMIPVSVDTISNLTDETLETSCVYFVKLLFTFTSLSCSTFIWIPVPSFELFKSNNIEQVYSWLMCLLLYQLG